LTLSDYAGLAGVLLMLGAYAASATGKLDPMKAPALVMNLAGPLLVLYSLSKDFNLSAALLEAAWALIAVVGLARLAMKKKD
jgi:hypothetical protein